MRHNDMDNTEPGAPDERNRSPARVVDMRIPLPWLLSGILSFAVFLGGMYFKLNQLGDDVTELKRTVSAGNSQQNEVHGELAILKYRMDILEKGHP